MKPPLWLVDWSDSEHDDFLLAAASAGVEARVLRGPALGTSVGTRWHGLRSVRAYSSLAIRGLRAAEGAPLIAWQPLVGAMLGLLRGRAPGGLVVLNPLIGATTSPLRRRILLRGLARADLVLFFSADAVEEGVGVGLQRHRLRFVPLGVKPAESWTPPTGDYFLAVGRDHRDWETLATAAEGLETEVRVVGPDSLSNPGPLRIVPQLERTRLLQLMTGARAIVVPLKSATRPAGQLTILDGLSVGRAIVSTRAPGVADYVSPETGILVPPGDAPALRDALVRLANQTVAERMGSAALAAARSAFSLERFIADVDREARALATGRPTSG